MERDTTSQKKEAAQFESEAWLDFRNFRIWRRSFRSEVSSCACRTIETMSWINGIKSVKCVADLKTSYSIIGVKLQTNFEVLDSKVASGLKKIINGDFNRKVLIEEEAAQQRQALSHGKASRMDDL